MPNTPSRTIHTRVRNRNQLHTQFVPIIPIDTKHSRMHKVSRKSSYISNSIVKPIVIPLNHTVRRDNSQNILSYTLKKQWQLQKVDVEQLQHLSTNTKLDISTDILMLDAMSETFFPTCNRSQQLMRNTILLNLLHHPRITKDLMHPYLQFLLFLGSLFLGYNFISRGNFYFSQSIEIQR